jgi:hypothetical protein
MSRPYISSLLNKRDSLLCLISYSSIPLWNMSRSNFTPSRSKGARRQYTGRSSWMIQVMCGRPTSLQKDYLHQSRSPLSLWMVGLPNRTRIRPICSWTPFSLYHLCQKHLPRRQQAGSLGASQYHTRSPCRKPPELSLPPIQKRRLEWTVSPSKSGRSYGQLSKPRYWHYTRPHTSLATLPDHGRWQRLSPFRSRAS